ncbi:MAG: SDR family oxidoreductase [Thermoflavifilum sp.]|nr:SDR family oxidoreductase [Thermoflavifilum sp.]
MDLHLTGKVFIVTGGAKGIGGAITDVLCAEGAHVVIAGRNAADHAKKLTELREKGFTAWAIEAELTQVDACKKVVDFTWQTFQRIDGLVNNAGVNDGVGLEKGDPARFMLSLEKNLLHYYVMAQLSLPALKQSQGAIVNIGSKVSLTGQGHTSGYAAAKGAINALTREWAVELLPYQIRVNTVLPAEVWTPFYASWIQTFPDPEAKLSSITRHIPLGKRMTKPEEIADMVAFLLSDRSSHTTGQIVVVDGGYTHLDRAIDPL